ncbi:MAG: ATP-dependent DNA helicase RecQ [Cyclobacteriaceae bacterium]|nr:RecQ family ATP-dependent DNA helicase [Cyclobacteriaceae bacterium]
METADQVLKRYWGYDHFRPPQREIVEAVLAGHDVVALLPTGGGKSVCFQVPAMMTEGLCLVVTPLIALMEDQVEQLKRRNISAVAIHSGMSRSELDITLDNCAYGKIKFLYLSPERIQTDLFRERLQKIKVNLIAIDEAHCISQWGYDFRPPYLLISSLRETKSDVPFMALTATATKQVREDIAEKLELREPKLFQKSFARPNLSFVARKTENKDKLLLQVLQKVNGSAIVYVRSRRATEQLANWLSKSNIAATYYHAGLTAQQRSENQKQWINGAKRVMVATNAFGMGIDKGDVRTVVHFDLPETLEAYYQEAGRAGRDGHRSYAVVIYHPIDVKNLRDKVTEGQPSVNVLKNTYQAIANYLQLAEGSAMGESFDFDINEFTKRYQLGPLTTFAAIKKLEEQGLIQLNESFYRPSRVHFQVDKKKLYEFQVANVHFDLLIKSLLRMYGAELFSAFVNISESAIGRSIKWSLQETKVALEQLHKMQFLHYEPASDKPQMTFLLARQDAQRLPVDHAKLEERRKLALDKMESMIDYVLQTHRCRTQVIQSYFDEETFGTCGVCDVCLDRKKNENKLAVKDYHDQILVLLREKAMTSDELEKAVNPDDHDLLVDVIREMLDSNEIKYDEYWVLRVVS